MITPGRSADPPPACATAGLRDPAPGPRKRVTRPGCLGVFGSM